MDREQEILITEEDAIETLKDYIFGNFEIPRTVRHAISFAIELIEKEGEGMKAVIGNHVITEEEIAIEKLNRALNDYLQDQETASQMEEAITYAVKILAGIVEEGK